MTKILWCVLVSLFKYMRLFQQKDGLFFFSNVTLYSFFPQKNLTGEEFSGSLQLTCQLLYCERELHPMEAALADGKRFPRKGFGEHNCGAS